MPKESNNNAQTEAGLLKEFNQYKNVINAENGWTPEQGKNRNRLVYNVQVDGKKLTLILKMDASGNFEKISKEKPTLLSSDTIFENNGTIKPKYAKALSALLDTVKNANEAKKAAEDKVKAENEAKEAVARAEKEVEEFESEAEEAEAEAEEFKNSADRIEAEIKGIEEKAKEAERKIKYIKELGPEGYNRKLQEERRQDESHNTPRSDVEQVNLDLPEEDDTPDKPEILTTNPAPEEQGAKVKLSVEERMIAAKNRKEEAERAEDKEADRHDELEIKSESEESKQRKAIIKAAEEAEAEVKESLEELANKRLEALNKKINDDRYDEYNAKDDTQWQEGDLLAGCEIYGQGIRASWKRMEDGSLRSPDYTIKGEEPAFFVLREGKEGEFTKIELRGSKSNKPLELFDESFANREDITGGLLPFLKAARAKGEAIEKAYYDLIQAGITFDNIDAEKIKAQNFIREKSKESEVRSSPKESPSNKESLLALLDRFKKEINAKFSQPQQLSQKNDLLKAAELVAKHEAAKEITNNIISIKKGYEDGLSSLKKTSEEQIASAAATIKAAYESKSKADESNYRNTSLSKTFLLEEFNKYKEGVEGWENEWTQKGNEFHSNKYPENGEEVYLVLKMNKEGVFEDLELRGGKAKGLSRFRNPFNSNVDVVRELFEKNGTVKKSHFDGLLESLLTAKSNVEEEQVAKDMKQSMQAIQEATNQKIAVNREIYESVIKADILWLTREAAEKEEKIGSELNQKVEAALTPRASRKEEAAVAVKKPEEVSPASIEGEAASAAVKKPEGFFSHLTSKIKSFFTSIANSIKNRINPKVGNPPAVENNTGPKVGNPPAVENDNVQNQQATKSANQAQNIAETIKAFHSAPEPNPVDISNLSVESSQRPVLGQHSARAVGGSHVNDTVDRPVVGSYTAKLAASTDAEIISTMHKAGR